MKFTKMHGCGNDYVYVNCFEENIQDPAAVARYVSDRHFGIGSDGLILICPSDAADFRMRMFNADGSEGNMCGNGIRCLAKYVHEHGMTDKAKITVETKSGIKELSLIIEDGKVLQVKVNMGTPQLAPRQIPILADGNCVVGMPTVVSGVEFKITCVSMGNPHAVIFVDDTEKFPLETLGPCFENHGIFPDRTNTEIVHVINPGEVNMRVWERGSGETLACGTGACAAVVACVLNGFTNDTVLVHLRGGDLTISYDMDADTVWMTGPAITVFKGEIDLPADERR